MLIRRLSLCALLLCSLAAQAALDLFLRLDGVTGDATDVWHRGEIVLTGYSFDFNQSATARVGGAGAGRVTISPFTVTKMTDSSSPRLALATASGQHFREATITVRRPGTEPFEFLRFVLTDVVVSGFSQDTAATGSQPMETVQLTFATIEMIYTPQTPTGAGTPVRMKWNVLQNRAE